MRNCNFVRNEWRRMMEINIRLKFVQQSRPLDCPWMVAGLASSSYPVSGGEMLDDEGYPMSYGMAQQR